ncbi:glycoside hydrolase family 2 protein [Pelagicoccus mobilis]|uniref:DUF4982 domain-containing protein n=1 Tax=Pelagicoccus mobilis TaxID=415221 RepID=A0A934RRZ0_9BACT|nr:glycoside hydrolase family 2 TIM barrel-domain containing protein [Pelagicoccus mobilis]MBK1875308.1 DUF4982 domain-containing protein [Pelagicoccus mobilis]
MKNLIIVLLAIATSFTSISAADLPFGFPETDRTKQSINQGWRFHRGEAEAEYYKKNYDDSDWELVDVPHTLALTSLTLDDLQDEKTQLVFHRDVGWYRKSITVTSSSSKKVFLEFEGAHQVTDLWVNGKHVGQHSIGGYTPFHFDISDFVSRGKSNQITLLVDNRRNAFVPPDPGPFDYVKFSGLYRDVYLVQTNPVHIGFNWESLTSGINITTPTIDTVNGNATINIKTAVKNASRSTVEAEVTNRIIDNRGIVVLKLIQSQKIAAGQELQFNQIGSLEDDVKFWDTENPNLYRVNTMVSVNGQPVDVLENRIGLRKFDLDPVRGFVLNGKPIKLIGFNRHQQYPYIGDALPDSLHYKDMLQFKEYGFNVMRTAHYPQDDALIDACDELGILVYEEAPSWISMSNDGEWWDNFEQSARIMIRNHRNHPSVVMWGAGINHRGYVPVMHNTVKQEDPTRLTASQGARWTGWQASGLTDINANMLYGPFIWDRSEPMFAMEGRSGAEHVAPYKQDDLMVGLISWVAHAYYTFHPTHDKANDKRDRTRSGAMTIFRHPRPYLDWYKAELLEAPFVDIKEEWMPGTEEVVVYSNALEVELFLNGKSISRQKPSSDEKYKGLDHPPFHFENIEYTEGKLVAKAYFEDGNEMESIKESAGSPAALRLVLDTEGREFHADGTDIVVAYAHIVDAKGVIVPDAQNLVTFKVEGDASVIGDGTNINANPMFPEYGVAPALIQAGHSPGKIRVTASSPGLRSTTVSLTSSTIGNDIVVNTAQAIYDFRSERVDLGAHDQLVQFDWNLWNGTDNEPSSYTLTSIPDASVTIAPSSESGVIRWLGEMNVIGKYGYAYGDGVVAIDEQGLDLTFEKLPKGIYKLTTWHHAPRSNSDHMDTNVDKLKSLTIHKVPYEDELTLSSPSLIEGDSLTTKVTEGKEMQFSPVATAEIVFESDGKSPVVINFNGSQNKGIWLNAFEISEWAEF